MKVLLIGHRGQLGSDLKRVFGDEELTLTTQDEMQVESGGQVQALVEQASPDLILNCAAFHRVDDCEDVFDRALAVNSLGVFNLARAAARVNATLVHFSTDYVFDGPGRTPYVESDLPCPQCLYGVSKLSGEFLLQAHCEKHFVFRVSGLYGYAGSREKGTNFVELMIGLARQGRPVRVVNDQVLTPTATMDVANAVRQVVQSQAYGLYHLTNAGQCSWFDFASTIFELAGLHPELTPVDSAAFPTRAKRPNYSVLENRRLVDSGYPDLPHWREALASYIAGRAAAGRP
jgi:dTDP-4-dehydrorhamnose reductase